MNKVIVSGLFRVETTDVSSQGIYSKGEFFKAENSDKCLADVLKYLYDSPSDVTIAKISDPKKPRLLRVASFSRPVMGGVVQHSIEIYRVEALTRGR